MPSPKPGTCLTRIATRLHLPQKILAYLSLSGVLLRENLALVEPECSIQIFHSAKSQLNFSLLVEETGGENSSIGGTSSDYDSGSDSESSADTYSQLESLAAPTIPSEIYLSINNFI